MVVVFHSVESAWHGCPGSQAFTSRDRPYSSLKGPFTRPQPSSEGLGLSPGTWGVPFYGNTDGFQGILELPGVCVVYCLALGPTLKKALSQTRPVGGTYDKWGNILSSHHEQWLPSSCRWQVLYFVDIIKISISFPTSVLVISNSITLQQNTISIPEYISYI